MLKLKQSGMLHIFKVSESDTSYCSRSAGCNGISHLVAADVLALRDRGRYVWWVENNAFH